MRNSARHVRARWWQQFIPGRGYVRESIASGYFGDTCPVYAEPRGDIMLSIATPQHAFNEGGISLRETDATCRGSTHG
jgi:hypothetical protein